MVAPAWAYRSRQRRGPVDGASVIMEPLQTKHQLVRPPEHPNQPVIIHGSSGESCTVRFLRFRAADLPTYRG